MNQTKKKKQTLSSPRRQTGKNIKHIVMQVRTDMAVFASLPSDGGFRSKAPSHEENGVSIGAWPAV
jgi:hypothetical protein